MQRGAAHADSSRGTDASEPGAAAATATASSGRAVSAATSAPAARATGAHRALSGHRDLGRDGIEVEHFADERSQRDDELCDLDAAAGHHLVRRARRQAHLFFGAEQDHVGERRFHRVANASATLGAGRVG